MNFNYFIVHNNSYIQLTLRPCNQIGGHKHTHLHVQLIWITESRRNYLTNKRKTKVHYQFQRSSFEAIFFAVFILLKHFRVGSLLDILAQN